MENAWPAVARDDNAPRASRDWARRLEAKRKYVVSASRRDFPWNNTVRVEGDLSAAVTQLKERTPDGLLVGSPMLSAALEQLGLIDEYRVVLHPVLAGHGPTLFQGLDRFEAPRAHLDEALQVRGAGAALPSSRGLTAAGFKPARPSGDATRSKTASKERPWPPPNSTPVGHRP